MGPPHCQYDRNGLRVRKESWRGVTDYVLSGKRLVHMARKVDSATEAELHFYYHETDKPSVCVYNGKRYGYVYNGMGDVMALADLNNSGHRVVTYAYDAWGKPIRCTGDLAETLGAENPFRYRGYVYDEETGLYYLRTRYYNPEWGRFVNGDSFGGRIGGLLSHSSFAYCCNDPVDMSDPTGCEPIDFSIVQSLGWQDVYSRKEGEREDVMIIDFYTGLSFEAYWPQVRDDGYHIDCFFQTGNQEKGVSLFAEFLGIDPGTDNDGWKQAKGWESRPVIVAMSDRTMTTGALVPFPHSGSPGTLNREGGHFDLYLKDSTQSSKQPSKTVLSYQATAKKASTLAKIELASQVLKRRRLEK